jgi:hypothetical protein
MEIENKGRKEELFIGGLRRKFFFLRIRKEGINKKEK